MMLRSIRAKTAQLGQKQFRRHGRWYSEVSQNYSEGRTQPGRRHSDLSRWVVRKEHGMYFVDVGSKCSEDHDSLPANDGDERDPLNRQSINFLRRMGRTVSHLSGLQAKDPAPVVFHVSSDVTTNTFSAGLDLALVHRMEPHQLSFFFRLFNDTYRTFWNLPAPTYAAVGGHAIAGGAVFAACCDHVVVLPSIKFGYPELAFGIPFPSSPYLALRQRLNPAWKDMLYSGAVVSGREAHAMQAVDHLVESESREDLLEFIVDHASKTHPPATLAAFPAVKGALKAPFFVGRRTASDETQSFLNCWTKNRHVREQYFAEKGIKL